MWEVLANDAGNSSHFWVTPAAHATGGVYMVQMMFHKLFVCQRINGNGVGDVVL